MHRALAILLLTFLPLQFSWAAVASYCEHETRIGAGHFGHHEHAHHGDAGGEAEPDDAGDNAPGGFDFDCGHCHGHFAGMLTQSDGVPGGLSTEPRTATTDEAGGAHAPPRPERPQWAALA